MNFPIVPEQASSFALEYDALFYVITGLTVFFTLFVFVMCMALIIKYRRGSNADRSNPMHHNTLIEVTWSFISLVLGLGIFTWGAKIYMEMREAPDDAMEIFVIGKRWMWHMQHSNGVRENNELHIPIGVPVKLTMISQDVTHAFYVPQFRTQFHVVPGRYTTMWFKATKTGRFNLFCNMHCGTQHSEMGGYVYVLPQNEWAEWMKNGGNRFKAAPKSLAEAGKNLYDEFNCASCHGERDGNRAPSLYGLMGRKREFTDGSSVVADTDYIRQSILKPEGRIVKGYRNLMQPYNFSEEQILSLAEYINTLGSPMPAGTSATAPANPTAMNATPITGAPTR